MSFPPTRAVRIERRRTLSLDYGNWQESRVGCRLVPPRERARDLALAKAFGERVKAVRMEQGMTQEKLAEASGLHPTFISNVERGYRVPTVPTLLRLANGLGVTAGQLVDGLFG